MTDRDHARRNPDGTVTVPARAESEDGRVIGDGMRTIGPDDPAYDAWAAWISQRDAGA